MEGNRFGEFQKKKPTKDRGGSKPSVVGRNVQVPRADDAQPSTSQRKGGGARLVSQPTPSQRKRPTVEDLFGTPKSADPRRKRDRDEPSRDERASATTAKRVHVPSQGDDNQGVAQSAVRTDPAKQDDLKRAKEEDSEELEKGEDKQEEGEDNEEGEADLEEGAAEQEKNDPHTGMVADTNVFSAIHEFLNGKAWHEMQPNKQNAINYLRKRLGLGAILLGKVYVPSESDKQAIANITRTLSATEDVDAELKKRGIKNLEYQVTKASPGSKPQLGDKIEIMKALENVNVGTKKGKSDRQIIADTLLSGLPFVTSDNQVFKQLFVNFGPNDLVQNAGRDADPFHERIVAKYPQGFPVKICDVNIIVVPLSGRT